MSLLPPWTTTRFPCAGGGRPQLVPHPHGLAPQTQRQGRARRGERCQEGRQLLKLLQLPRGGEEAGGE